MLARSTALFLSLVGGGCGGEPSEPTPQPVEGRQETADPELQSLQRALAELADPSSAAARTYAEHGPEPLDELLSRLTNKALPEMTHVRLEDIDRPLREAVGAAELALARAEMTVVVDALRTGRGLAPATEPDAEHQFRTPNGRRVVFDPALHAEWGAALERLHRARDARRERIADFLRDVGIR